MTKFRLAIIMSLSVALVLVPTLGIVIYKSALGAGNDACDATMGDKSILWGSTVLCCLIAICSLVISKRRHDATLIVVSAIAIPAPLVSGFVMLLVLAGYFF